MLSVSSVRDPFLRALSEQVKHSVGRYFRLSVHSLSLFRDDAWVFGERYRSCCASLFQSHRKVTDRRATGSWDGGCQQLDHE